MNGLSGFLLGITVFQLSFLVITKSTGDDGGGWLLAIMLQALGAATYILLEIITWQKELKPWLRFLIGFLSLIAPVLIAWGLLFGNLDGNL